MMAILLTGFTGNAQSNFNLSDTLFSIGQKYELKEIRFYFEGNDRIANESKNELDSVAYFLKRNPHLIVEISTHTDSRGSANSNLMLSQSRSEWLRNYIIQQGVNPKNISAKGYGESEPIIQEEEINKYRNSDKDEYKRLHQRNRRTELKIMEIDAP